MVAVKMYLLIQRIWIVYFLYGHVSCSTSLLAACRNIPKSKELKEIIVINSSCCDDNPQTSVIQTNVTIETLRQSISWNSFNERLYFLSGDVIKSTRLNGTSSETFDSITGVSAFDLDVERQWLFYSRIVSQSSQHGYAIEILNLKDNSTHTLLPGLYPVATILVDPLNQRVFWNALYTSPPIQSISYNGTDILTHFAPSVRVRLLAINPSLKRVYYSYNSRLIYTTYDGKNNQTYNKDVKAATCYYDDTLLVSHGNTIMLMNLGGQVNNTKTMYTDNDITVSFEALAIILHCPVAAPDSTTTTTITSDVETSTTPRQTTLVITVQSSRNHLPVIIGVLGAFVGMLIIVGIPLIRYILNRRHQYNMNSAIVPLNDDQL